MMGALLKAQPASVSSQPPAHATSHVIVLEAMDELFEAVVRTFALSPTFLRSLLHRDRATQDYEQENRHPIPLA
jgi:hypothetical protein